MRLSENLLQAALFDLDGVIAPTAALHQQAWASVLDRYLAAFPGQRPCSAEDYRRFIDGRRRENGIETFLRARDLPVDCATVDLIAEAKNTAFHALLDAGAIAPRPGVARFLEGLKADGVKCGLFTASRNAARVLAAIGLGDAFGAVVDGNVAKAEGLASKPAPDLPLSCARKLGAIPARCVLFEDAIAGIAAGRAGGFGRVVGVAEGSHAAALLEAGADTVIATFESLETGQVLG